MGEVIRHSLGLCGEGHPSLLYFIPAITFGIYVVKLYSYSYAHFTKV